jgi:Domain of unknown function (DUF4430)
MDTESTPLVQTVKITVQNYYTGSGDAAFLTRIDDVPNEGGGGGRKSWQLWVNTAYADRSFGVYEIQALDVVYWRFTTKEGK